MTAPPSCPFVSLDCHLTQGIPGSEKLKRKGNLQGTLGCNTPRPDVKDKATVDCGQAEMHLQLCVKKNQNNNKREIQPSSPLSVTFFSFHVEVFMILLVDES